MSGSETIVIKLGGEVVARPEVHVLADDIAALVRRSLRIVVVHGGGPQATELQTRLGQTPVQIAGRRVTDAATLDVMKMALAGKVNVDLCSALVRAGALPVGLHGGSSQVIGAAKRPPRVYAGAGEAPVDLGLVGDVVSIRKELIELLLTNGYVPVLACLGAGSDGQVYNINADAVANRVACDLQASSLFMVSDVPGVLRDSAKHDSRIARLSVSEGRELIQNGSVTKGMIVKLEESFAALNAGVQRIHIVGKLAPGALIREVDDPGAVGTAIVR